MDLRGQRVPLGLLALLGLLARQVLLGLQDQQAQLALRGQRALLVPQGPLALRGLMGLMVRSGRLVQACLLAVWMATSTCGPQTVTCIRRPQASGLLLTT